MHRLASASAASEERELYGHDAPLTVPGGDLTVTISPAAGGVTSVSSASGGWAQNVTAELLLYAGEDLMGSGAYVFSADPSTSPPVRAAWVA